MKFEEDFKNLIIKILVKLSVHLDTLCKGFFFRTADKLIRDRDLKKELRLK